ncbi:hypothetical protein [Streptomyces sp. NPDC101132]|uniref:hypothetical protein n=1 Tax=Streptomyces sp. NPDC101132 TaxID=3366110 RepID=UPI0038061C8A
MQEVEQPAGQVVQGGLRLVVRAPRIGYQFPDAGEEQGQPESLGLQQDVGKALNLLSVVGQIQGGTVQGPCSRRSGRRPVWS